jgi:hypothetical protein
MLPDHDKDVLQLFLGANLPMTTEGASNDSAGYSPVLPKTYTFFVRRAGEKQKMKTPPVHIVDGSFFTILATLKNGAIDLQVIDDTIDPNKDDGSARLVVRQYYPEASPSVAVGSGPPATLDYGDVITLDHLPTSQIPITIHVTLPGGTAKDMNMTVDLRKKRHAEMILVADSYARFRPFFAVDGQTDVDLASVSSHAQPTPNHSRDVKTSHARGPSATAHGD